MKSRFLPLLAFLVVALALGLGLGLKPREIPSPFIGKNLPSFSLAKLENPAEKFSPSELAGRPWLLNVWASWCVACKQEHPVLMQAVRQYGITVVGLDYKDQRPQALAFLEQRGNPYLLSVMDDSGSVGIDLGVTGVPETFVIDASGIVRFKHIGPLTFPIIEQSILPILRETSAAPARGS